MQYDQILHDIQNQYNIDDNEILRTFFDTIKNNNISMETFFQNREAFNQIISQLKHRFTPEQMKILKSSLDEIFKTLQEKNLISNDIINYVNQYYYPVPNDDDGYNTPYTYVVFILLIIVFVLTYKKVKHF